MIAIPLPFVITLLLLLTSVFVYFSAFANHKRLLSFIGLSAILTCAVGLRWQTGSDIVRLLQPMLSAIFPFTAFWCFQQAYRNSKIAIHHLFGPLVVALGLFIAPFVVDLVLIALYFGYGCTLLLASRLTPQQVRLAQITQVKRAQRGAGVLLMLCGVIDSAIFLDLSLFNAQFSPVIISSSYLLIVPALVFSVLVLGMSFPSALGESKTIQPADSWQDEKVPLRHDVDQSKLQECPNEINKTHKTHKTNEIDETDEAQQIVIALDALLRGEALFTDPDLTLSRLARKLGRPARQISRAVNHITGENIS
uniref:hypothetical protein n=1 Tax=Thaumasiovibrio occultus TaxID=1891184 RepID=UPI000B35D764